MSCKNVSFLCLTVVVLIGTNNPGDSSGVQSCPGRHPNHNVELLLFFFFLYIYVLFLLLIEVHARAAEALRVGTAVFAKRPEDSLHITSSSRV